MTLKRGRNTDLTCSADRSCPPPLTSSSLPLLKVAVICAELQLLDAVEFSGI